MQKTILITGASDGFGKDAALTLAARGHHVLATMRDADGRNREAAASLRARGIELVEMDVTQDASVDSAFPSVLQKTGATLDVLEAIGISGLSVLKTTRVPQQPAASETSR